MKSYDYMRGLGWAFGIYGPPWDLWLQGFEEDSIENELPQIFESKRLQVAAVAVWLFARAMAILLASSLR